MSELLTRIAERLAQNIPEPAKPAVKEQKSWAGLKPGQRLADSKGLIWEILGVDSVGMMLERGELKWRWDDRDWSKEFKKLPKERKKRV